MKKTHKTDKKSADDSPNFLPGILLRIAIIVAIVLAMAFWFFRSFDMFA